MTLTETERRQVNGIHVIPSNPQGQFHVSANILRRCPPPTLHRSQKKEMSLITEEAKEAAEIYRGDDICQEKSKWLLKEMGLPNGLLPLQDMEECGYVKQTGFVWLKQKKKSTHKFEKIGRLVSYEPEVTAYVEANRIKKLTGVKTKELLLWISVSDIFIDDPNPEKITFKTPAGLSRTFPVPAFQIEEEKEDVKESK